MSMFAIGDIVVHKETGGEYDIIAAPGNALMEWPFGGWMDAYVYCGKGTINYFTRSALEMESGKFEKKEAS